MSKKKTVADQTQENSQQALANETVSVIMPCYNDGAFIEAAIDSLRKQTYKDIELIVIDDGSDDPETIETVNHLSFPHMQLLHTNHLRPAGARNFGISYAKGQYILPLDSDDLIEPEYIEKAVKVLQTQPSVGIVYCHADLFGAATGKWELPDYSLKTELLDNVIFVTALFRKCDWAAVGGFAEDLKAGMEDYDFWLSILSLDREVVQFPEIYFHYRIKESSRTTQFMDNYAAVQATYVQLYNRHRDFYTKHMDIYCTELRRQLIDHIYTVKSMQKSLELSSENDPVITYWLSVRALKPNFASFVEKMLRYKDRLKSKFKRT